MSSTLEKFSRLVEKRRRRVYWLERLRIKVEKGTPELERLDEYNVCTGTVTDIKEKLLMARVELWKAHVGLQAQQKMSVFEQLQQ